MTGRPKQVPVMDLRRWPESTITTGQLARYWGCHIQTVQSYIRRGYLDVIRTPGERGSYRVKVSSALDYERRDPAWRRRPAS